MSHHLAHNNPYILSSRRVSVPASDVHEKISELGQLIGA
jgi:hypothetical protein